MRDESPAASHERRFTGEQLDEPRKTRCACVRVTQRGEELTVNDKRTPGLGQQDGHPLTTGSKTHRRGAERHRRLRDHKPPHCNFRRSPLVPAPAFGERRAHFHTSAARKALRLICEAFTLIKVKNNRTHLTVKTHKAV